MNPVVVDCSALIDWISEAKPTNTLSEALGGELHSPELLDFEYIAAVRRRWLATSITVDDAQEALSAFLNLTIRRHSADRLTSRIWSLRDNFSAYDASYVALAEALDIPLVTRDHKLAKAAREYCEVIVG